MNWKSKKIDLLLALIINVFFLLIYIYCFIPLQESNDDISMSFLVEGVYGTHSEYMIFENILWGKFLVGMSKILPTIKWYNVMSYVMIFMAFTEMTYAFLRMHGRKIGAAISAVLLIFGGYQTYILFQFSRVTAIGTIGGMIMLFYALEHAKGKMESRFCMVAGGFLSVWASMMRFEMFALSVALVVVALAVYRLFILFTTKSINLKKEIVRYVTVFGAVGVLSLALYAVNAWYYQKDEQWSTYKEYNELRAELWDKGFPIYADSTEVYSDLGISEADYSYYLQWNMDEEVMSIETMKTLIDAKVPKERSLQEFFSKFPSEHFMPLTVYILFLVIGVVAIAINMKNIYFVAFEFVAVFAAELFLYYTGRYGFPRVDNGMWLAAIAVVLYGMAGDFKAFEGKSGRIAFVVAGTALIINSAWLHDYSHYQEGKMGSTKVAYQEIMQDKEHLYIMLMQAPSAFYAYDFWEPCGVGDFSNVYNAYGWDYNLEVKQDILDSYGIENIYRDAINNENVYFIGGPASVMLEQYVRENYNANAKFYPVKEIMNCYVWSIRTDE